MCYPLTPGGDEAEAGMISIQKMEEMEIETPVIVCSSVPYRVWWWSILTPTDSKV